VSRHRSIAVPGRVWAIPACVLAAQLFALIAALLADDAWDWVAWALLAWPAGILGRAWFRPGRHSHQEREEAR
jgi:hypothetical protein